jgi:hypothetical protein
LHNIIWIMKYQILPPGGALKSKNHILCHISWMAGPIYLKLKANKRPWCTNELHCTIVTMKFQILPPGVALKSKNHILCHISWMVRPVYLKLKANKRSWRTYELHYTIWTIKFRILPPGDALKSKKSHIVPYLMNLWSDLP